MKVRTEGDVDEMGEGEKKRKLLKMRIERGFVEVLEFRNGTRKLVTSTSRYMEANKTRTINLFPI